MEFYLTAFQLALCLAPMCMGIFITMKIFKIPDITTDGSYTLGAAVTAIMLSHHLSVYAALPVSVWAGAIAGTLTGIIHTKLKIDALLAGILVMTGLYSVNLIILGRSNLPLIDVSTLFNSLHFFSNDLYNAFAIGLLTVVLLAGLLTYLLKTDFGIAMRAVGSSESMTSALGINNDKIKIAGLAIANAFTALSGYLVAQYQGFSDINMGIGIVIIGLGAVLIGDAIRTWFSVMSIGMQIGLVIAGSLLFQLVLAVTLSAGVDPNLLKLITAGFVLGIVALPRLTKSLAKP